MPTNLTITTNVPQEIINLIIDEIALDQSNQEVPTTESLTTLRACSLVSKSFHYQCQKYIFSNITIIADTSVQEKCGLLIKILQHKFSKHLLAGVRAVALEVDMPSGRSTPMFFEMPGLGRTYRQSKRMCLKLATKLGIRQNKLLKVLEMLNQAPLEKFTVRARSGCLDWTTINGRGKAIFLAIRSNPALRVLHCQNVINFDKMMLVGNGPSNNLRELNLIFVFQWWTTNPVVPLSTALMANLASLERLTIIHSPYDNFFPTSPLVLLSACNRNQPGSYFSRLQILTISFPYKIRAVGGFWKTITSLSRSLQILDIRDIWCPLDAAEINHYFGDFSFDRLSALRQLKLSSHRDYDLPRALMTIRNLLRTSSDGITLMIESMEIQTPLQILPQFPLDNFNEAIMDLDQILSGPRFLHLRRLSLDIAMPEYSETSALPAISQETTSRSVRAYFPKVLASPSIQFILDLKLG